MKRTLLFPIIVIVSFLFIIGCSGKQATQNKGAFLGGTTGVVASFEPLSIEENGIYTIFDSDDFPLEVVLNNKGEETLGKGKATLRLLGPPQTAFGNIPAWQIKNAEEIEKISEFNPEGGEEILSFAPLQRAKYKEKVTGFTDVNWNLEYWYDYKTHFIINDVCFKGDVTDPKVCVIKEGKSFSVSGAPVTVTGVSEDSGGKGIILVKIDIQNAGQGKATLTGQEFDRRFDQVHYTIQEPEKWKCTSSGRENEARLIDGKAQIICRLKDPLKDEELYTKQVTLTFDYTYKDLLQTKLRIKESKK